jgi:DnaJ family protein C protein 19
MLWLILGGLALVFLMGGLRAFERASVDTIKSLFAWIIALGGLSLGALLLLSGRGAMAISGLVMFGPLIWQHWRASQSGQGRGAQSQSQSQSQPPPRRSSSGMTMEEAWQVLGLQPGADADAIRAAHRRLMRGAHPDGGGSDWLAARVNQARDLLLDAQRRA